jgi:hypothetical protein
MNDPKSLSEAFIQQQIIMWYRNTFCLKIHQPRSLIMSIPNEGKSDLYRTGLLPGAADIILFHKSPSPMFVEVKTESGTQSEKQKEFEQYVRDLGIPYRLVRSLDDFKKIFSE